MLKISVVYLAFLSTFISATLLQNHRDPITDLIHKHGYPVKTYEIVTSDGYVLRLHRLFGKENFDTQIHHKSGCPVKPAVLIVHGFLGCSADFVMFGPNKSLGFQLVENGYDVWLGNVRGGKFTESHVSMKASMPEFWNYTITELSVIDTAEMIDYVRDITGSFKIFYIGNSFGATYLAILLSEKPEYNEKIIQAGLMAPIIYTGQKVPESLLTAVANRAIYSMLQMTPSFRYSDIMDFTQFYQTMFCAPRNSECPLVLTIKGMLYGWNEDGKYMDPEFSNVVNFTAPNASSKLLRHNMQMRRNREFRRFKDTKMEKSKFYDISKITIPLRIQRGLKDTSMTDSDYKAFFSRIKSVNATMHTVTRYGHVEVNYGQNVTRLVFNDMIAAMDVEKHKYYGENGECNIQNIKKIVEKFFSIHPHS